MAARIRWSLGAALLATLLHGGWGSPPAGRAAEGWNDTGSLPAWNPEHAATLLANGQVLGGGGDAVWYDAATPGVCFVETGRCVRGAFLDYWTANGGLARNGFPLSDEFAERLEDGKVYRVQYFERVRLEWHPENAAPNDVLLGQFGRRVHPADPPLPPPTGPTLADRVYFAQTGHYIIGAFFDYWYTNGGLAQYGYPITEEFEETLENGRTYRVQYFERARFEHHPENQPPYDILLGQFGRRFWGGR